MRKAVGGALFNDGKLLLLKRSLDRKTWPGVWEIHGGKIEAGESDGEALVREFIEETGLKIECVDKYYTFHYDYAGTPAEENDYFVFSEDFEVIISDEHTEYCWATKSDAEKLPMSPDMKKSVLAAFEMAHKL